MANATYPTAIVLPFSDVAMNFGRTNCCLRHAGPGAANSESTVAGRYTRTKALSPTRVARLVSTNKGQSSVTALQDWLSIRPVDPKGLKALTDVVRGALRSLTAEDSATDRELPLLRPGVERC